MLANPAPPDPRAFPALASAPEPARECYLLAEASLRAETAQQADAVDRRLRAALAPRLDRDGAALAALLAGAPSVEVARHLWRAIDATAREATGAAGTGLAVTVFALPVVVVVGHEEEAGEDGAHPGILPDAGKLAEILREHGALAGNRTFTLSNALVAGEAIDVARLPEILAFCRLPDALAPGEPVPMRAFAPSPIPFQAGREAVHLRFLVGGAIAKPGVDLTADADTGKWGIALTRELVAQLGAGGASVLALPRVPQRLLPALAQGRAAQREISLQIFASNAIRRLRSTVGEPTAIISAHRAPSAPGGGELRLSLSSPLDPKAAEGFRCPLYPLDRVGDVASVLVSLLRDCRVTDVRVLKGVHADRVAGTGMPLLFKAQSIPDAAGPGGQ